MEQKFLYQNKKFVDRRKELRKNQTETEKKLWSRIRRSQIDGFKFVRQYSIGPYILDFYCPLTRLAIELDGSQHSEIEAVLYDKDREKYLESVDIKVLRFWNNEILENTEKVLERIYQELLKLVSVFPS
jgi:very-short-patch-repair endonuclease